MKKLLAVLAFAGLSLSGFAQDATPTEKYSVATNSFWSNWFIQLSVVWTARRAVQRSSNVISTLHLSRCSRTWVS